MSGSTSTPPKTVGSRELKTRLGTYLRQVREGARLVVTDRGHPVAELRPLSLEGSGLEDRLERLAARGIVAIGDMGTFGTSAADEVRERVVLPDFEPIQNRGDAASHAILEDREDRF